MKSIILLVALFGAFSVQAADRKVGNVIIVERDVDNLYSRCMASYKDQAQAKKEYHFCTIQITKSPAEVLLNTGGAIRYTTPGCSVQSDFGNGKMLISFRALAKDATVEDAKRCLAAALQDNQDIVATVQTLE